MWCEREISGERKMAFERSTFVIDAAGNLAHILRGVDPVAHIGEVEAFVRINLQG